MASLGTNPADSIAYEQQATSQLLELLEQEQLQLIESNIDELNKLTEQKAKIIERLSELTKWRHKALAAAGFPGKEAGMQDWLKTADGSKVAIKLWPDLVALTRSAKELNRTNGLLIGKHLARNQSALNVLHGNTQNNTFYGPTGHSTTTASTRRIVIG